MQEEKRLNLTQINQIRDISQRMRALEEELEYHSELYYVLDSAVISDHDYDEMFSLLQKLEEENPALASETSPTKRVGGRVLDKFEKFSHAVPLDSLKDVFSKDELYEFDRKLKVDEPDATYVTECKIDGLSITLEYIDGVFYRGLTRGDGESGEDITENLKTIKSIPLKLKEPIPRLIVRGEAFIPLSVFHDLNRIRIQEGLEPFANPRNLAAGSVRQLDSSVMAQRRLDAFIFNLQLIEGPELLDHSKSLDYLTNLGFKVSPIRQTNANIDEVWATIEQIDFDREKFDFAIDGAVVKVDSFAIRQRLGQTSNHPKWAVAYKYNAEVASAVVRDIIIQVGRTGALTPKVVFDTVRLGGTNVSQASLHNFDYIREKDIRIGDTVKVRKAGEIIPQIVEVDIDLRPGMSVEFSIPTTCPSCGEAVDRVADGAILFCVNPDCPSKSHRKILHFVSRGGMNIEGLGERTVELFIKNNLIENIADLYFLKKEDIASLEGMGEKSADRILASLEDSKTVGFARLLYALGIKNIGEKASRILAEQFISLKSLMQADKDRLCDINEIGPESAMEIINYFSDPENKEILDLLEKAGVITEQEQPTDNKDSILEGMTFVITGTLPTMNRREAQELILQHGGNVSGSVSSKTSYVLFGDSAGSKLDKAIELNIPILTEEELLNMIKQEQEQRKV